MTQETNTNYYCDNCNKNLPTCDNSLTISTTKSDSNIGWSRLHIKIEHHHGSHNDEQIEDADLCQACTLALLKDALNRVKAGERVSEGVESADAEGWNGKRYKRVKNVKKTLV